jgi:hypothetical protein
VVVAIGAICVIAVSVYIFSLLSTLQFFTITNVVVSAADQSKINIIHDQVLTKLQGKYLGLFSRANDFLYPHGAIIETIKTFNTEVSSVDVTRSDRHTLTVSIVEKTPAALICTTLPDFNGNELMLDGSGDCYFVDASGFIFKKAPSFSSRVYHRYYVPDLAGPADLASTTGVVGMYATSTAEFQSIQKIYDGLEANSIKTDAALIKGGGEYEWYVRNPGMSSSTAVIYFNTVSSTTEQFSNLISFWSHSLSVARTNKEILEFDYIDVRYGDNVFFRKSR